MQLYLSYCELLIIYKIDFVALAITSQLVDAYTQPYDFLACYVVLTLFIHLPSIIITRKGK